MQKSKVPAKVHHFQEGHIVTFAATVVSGLISTVALSYHVWIDLKTDLEAIRWTFTILAGAFAFLMAMTPISLARAHGEAIEGGTAQSVIMFIVLMTMIIDGALQVHAAHYIIKMMGQEPPAIWMLAIGAGLFQLSMFMVRGGLYAASREIRELIDARQERLDQAAAYAREQINAKRREQYAESRSGLRVV